MSTDREFYDNFPTAMPAACKDLALPLVVAALTATREMEFLRSLGCDVSSLENTIATLEHCISGVHGSLSIVAMESESLRLELDPGA